MQRSRPLRVEVVEQADVDPAPRRLAQRPGDDLAGGIGQADVVEGELERLAGAEHEPGHRLGHILGPLAAVGERMDPHRQGF